MLWLWSQLWGLEAVHSLPSVKSCGCLQLLRQLATSFVMSAARPATLTSIAQRLWEGRETRGESLTGAILYWQACPISTFGWHLTLSWVDDSSLDSWSSGGGGRSTVNGQLSGEHSFKVALPQNPLSHPILISCRRMGGFMFFCLFHTSLLTTVG